MVSVVLSTYNGEKYLREQLLSLKNQTKKIDEVIISDDGSTDRTIDIVKNFIVDNQLLNWSLFINEENKGWKRNFVETVSLTKGDYIFFCDQDDIWLSHKVETMVSIMESDSNIDVLAGRYIKFTEIPPVDIDIVNNGVKQALRNDLISTDLPGCVYCVRQTFWKKIAPFWNGVYAHDAFVWNGAKLFGTAYILEEPVIYWRRHADSTYTRFSEQIKTKRNRIIWLKEIEQNIICLESIANRCVIEKEILDKVSSCKIFLELRVELLTKFNLLIMVELLKYLSYYNKKKQFVLEMFLAVKS